MFNIPEAKSVKTLFVTGADYYTAKTGEIRATAEALVKAPTDRNQIGYAHTVYNCDYECYEALREMAQAGQVPAMVTFETESRAARNAYGNSSNVDFLVRVMPQANQPKPQTK